ncbi:DUF3833 domain-containing protein [Pseudomonas cannabina]|uniref:Lipoprotein n=3 Tax=Pseudomonas syringae group TaxID=136849 RepID=A0A3M3QTM5_PSECA|nr:MULTISPECIES: DUF3833 domain-containing protein [Pseudomonas syringae group]KPB72826.1 Lipoprotein [Pseudomonas syringae pv. maculicola]KPW20698.1 Lipoprotein [Pseudomonas cannabina pv. alisalensis]MBM0141991.1 DUF3833 domain-containing protein [Pseudomonas cannabina pv. alisalensis]QHE97023.1 DUF3833 family protein [Pseudomonas syringae pv. maculicola str. ES4326]QQN19932.1 DUF3833 domain-containing protein [Pseudomonas cannabina pv. alisalensis]
MLKKWMVLLCLGLALSGCGGVPVSHYSQEAPKLDLRKYFTGRVEAWGMFQKRSGEVTKRFTVVIDGHSEGEVLVMHEAFSYSDGTKQVREWRLRPDGPGRWKGTAGDVVGEAYGEVAGNSFHWNYVLRLPVDGTEYDVSLDDWMYLIDEQTMANRSSMSKLGVEVGQITLFFRKTGK